MLILTFQHKSVLDIVKRKGRYYCEIESDYSKESPMLYKYLRELIYSKTGIDSRPVFGWSALVDYSFKWFKETYSMVTLDLSKIDERCFISACDKVGYNYNEYLAFLLDVPSNLVATHSFYDFAGYKADEMEDLVSEKEIRKFIYSESWLDGEDLQSTFPYIDKSFIKCVYSYKYIKDKHGDLVGVNFKELTI